MFCPFDPINLLWLHAWSTAGARWLTVCQIWEHLEFRAAFSGLFLTCLASNKSFIPACRTRNAWNLQTGSAWACCTHSMQHEWRRKDDESMTCRKPLAEASMAQHPPSSESPWKEFAQKEDLTVRLSNILQDYAFGPGVFRELLQNADDAGASRFALYADNTYHRGYQEASEKDQNDQKAEADGLLDSRLAWWQGPAIMAFNDALFSEEDFEGICRVGASIKQSDHTKIGRYGLGFNATYHLTDVVSFVSNDRFCIFDPHRTHLPSNLPGLQISLTDASREQFSAQLAPFNDVLDAEGAHRPRAARASGTLFRLPLRTKKLAAKSLISQQSHRFEDLKSLLLDFLAVAGEA